MDPTATIGSRRRTSCRSSRVVRRAGVSQPAVGSWSCRRPSTRAVNGNRCADGGPHAAPIMAAEERPFPPSSGFLSAALRCPRAWP
jgi:hypothetical protein